MQEGKSRGDYMTRGYFLVKGVLQDASGKHLSVDDIYGELSSRGERIGRTTVYRQLERLISEGRARRIGGDKTGNCYSYNAEGCSEHHHLICTVCGKLAHLSCDHVEELFHHIKAAHGFIIDPSRTSLYGTCASCLRKQKQKGLQNA